MAIFYNCVCENGSAGTYWASLSTAEKERYGTSGSERVYSTLVAGITSRGAVSTRLDIEVFEICDAFTESRSSAFVVDWTNIASFQVIITTNKNYLTGGLPDMTAGFHNGSFSAGYVFSVTSGSWYNAVELQRGRVTIDGIRIYVTRAGIYGLYLEGDRQTISRNLIELTSTDSTVAIYAKGSASEIHNNVAIADRGYSFANYTGRQHRVYNNLAVKCNHYGFLGADSVYGTYSNNLAIGCGTNWGLDAGEADHEGMNNNAGESGDAVWDSSGTAITTLTTADFLDYAGNDFRPATAASSQVGAGILLYSASDYDCNYTIRPNYNPSGEENWDIGPFEYDHGNGLAPKTVTLEITNIVAGSELAIYKASDNSVIVAPQTVSGTSYSTSYTYTADTLVTIVLRNASGVTKYQPYKTQGNITANGLSVYVSQVEDIIAQ